MVRYILLVNYTQAGISQIQNTVARAADFQATAAAMGVMVESQLWTLGEYDGVLTLVSDDENKVIAITTHLAKKGYVRTCLMKAYSETEFADILALMPTTSTIPDAGHRA
jgi:uncharacterized protein with GYD domain